MRRLRFAQPVRLLLGAAAFAACSATAFAADAVKIAFIEVLSGPFANSGQTSLNQLREVVAQLNATASPTDAKLQIVPFDGKGSPQESASALKAAFDQDIRYVTQGGGSGVALALIDAINKQADRDPGNAMVYLNYAAQDPSLTNDKCSFWHFRFYPSSEMQIEGLTTYLEKKPEIKKVFLFNQNYTHGQQVAKASRAYLARKRPDIQIVGEDFIPIATVRDFAPYVAKIAASGADTVITSNWGTDLGLLFKAAKDYNLNINFYTFNGNNPGIPAQIGSWGAGKIWSMWNWGSNAPTPALEKIAVAYKKKVPDEDFIYASHWYTMHMLRAALRKAKSSDPTKVAFALEGMKYDSPLGEVEMRKTDHQLLAPVYMGVWAKQGSPGVKYDAENTGYGFKSEVVWEPYLSAQPTSCQMKRPPA
ncbi:branched-chain amino acid ABC transporter substrate-binding protein [Variovorax rhizosphaerae]|uniref:Branched-chain amino acid ABC transporter substrate-binding protein n=1 Tax=Variovorax rhizosphaerae TaxID=1836200 RepID=A0ABU8WII8_9BURK